MKPEIKAIEPWHVYMLSNRFGHIYTGVTNDLARRVREHQSSGPRCAKALKGKGPLHLLFTYQAQSKRQAMQLEYRIKALSTLKKHALINGSLSILSLLD